MHLFLFMQCLLSGKHRIKTYPVAVIGIMRYGNILLFEENVLPIVSIFTHRIAYSVVSLHPI